MPWPGKKLNTAFIVICDPQLGKLSYMATEGFSGEQDTRILEQWEMHDKYRA